jgi:hypothetical protein
MIFLWVNRRKVNKLIKKNNYDYVIFPFQWQWYLVSSIKKQNNKIQVIWIIHDFNSHNILWNSFFHIVLRNLCINQLFESDKIIFISENTKKEFLDLKIKFNWKYKLISNIVNSTNFYKINWNLNYIYEKFNLPWTKIFLSITGGWVYKNDLTFFKIANLYKQYFFVKVGNITNECKKYI